MTRRIDPRADTDRPPCVALDVRMWNHSGIGSYLHGLTGGLAALPDPPRLECLGPAALADEAAARHAGWTARPFDRPLYGAAEQLRPALAPGRWDLYHAPHYNFPLRWPARRPLAVTLHDLIHLDSPHPLKRAYLRFFLRRLLARAEGPLRVLTGSEATRRRLLEALPRLERLQPPRIIAYGIDPAYLAGPPEREAVEAWRRRRALPADYLLLVGNALPHKNHAFVLRALLAPAPPLPLVLCGMGEAGADRLMRLAHSLLPDPPVRCFPRLEQPEMPLLYAAATALVFPSLAEGYGLPIVEAQAVGTPTLVSDRPAPREAGGEAALLFDPTDPESLRDALERLLGDAALRAERVRRGRERTQVMTWERAAEQTAAVYAELSAEGRA